MSDRLHIRTAHFCGEKVVYPDGEGCCVWIPFEDDEDVGIGFDFGADEIDELIDLLGQLKVCAPHDEVTQADIDREEQERQVRAEELRTRPDPICERCGHADSRHLGGCMGSPCDCEEFVES